LNKDIEIMSTDPKMKSTHRSSTARRLASAFALALAFSAANLAQGQPSAERSAAEDAPLQLRAKGDDVLVAPGGKAKCPKQDALNVSRVMIVGTSGGPTVGLKSYPQTLALEDHEVVLTFDDGPSSATTPIILDALKRECVLATFFLIGKNAERYPALVQREKAEGHTIAFHSYSHPEATLRRLTEKEGEVEILRGVEAVEKAAAVEPRPSSEPPARFFRFPGFADTQPLLQYLARNNFAVFGTDVWASDWVSMTPETQLRKILARLEESKGGIVLFHDTREQTAVMIPEFLRQLKLNHFRIVHIVPGSGPLETKKAPLGWTSETDAIIARVMARRDRDTHSSVDAISSRSASRKQNRIDAGVDAQFRALERPGPVEEIMTEPQ
jgi:peptidoglycan/xylan/chitin deacetylase (PgdA/CDA1 family)